MNLIKKTNSVANYVTVFILGFVLCLFTIVTFLKIIQMTGISQLQIAGAAVSIIGFYIFWAYARNKYAKKHPLLKAFNTGVLVGNTFFLIISILIGATIFAALQGITR